MHSARMEPAANMHRFHRIEMVRDLFDDWALVRDRGRIGCSGQVRTDWLDSETVAKERFIAGRCGILV